jgi:LPS O-antigen subunit length determinant protein (WzzB/FepE family)
MEPQLQQHTAPATDPDEINLLEYIYALVKHKWWIIGFTLLGAALGTAVPHIKKPKFVTEVQIAPRETDQQKTPNLSGLGALGGLVASQINLGGNASLDKIEQILGTRKFNADLYANYDLLPLIYKNEYPKMYKTKYDSVAKKWNPPFTAPSPLSMGGLLKSKLKQETKNNVMTLKVTTKDSLFSATVLSCYLQYLNQYIKAAVENDAKENVAYLENRMISIPDPFVREKVQQMIATEIEKSMLVSKEAFRVVDLPYSYIDAKNPRLYQMVLAAGFFFLAVLGIVFGHAFSSADKTEEDRLLIAGIKRELTKI